MCIANYHIINHRIYTATRQWSVFFTYMCVFMYLSMYLYIYLCNLCPPPDCGWYVLAVTDTQHFVFGLPTQRCHHSHESASRQSFKSEWLLISFTLKLETEIDKNQICSFFFSLFQLQLGVYPTIIDSLLAGTPKLGHHHFSWIEFLYLSLSRQQ